MIFTHSTSSVSDTKETSEMREIRIPGSPITHFRPKLHITDKGWINDPCAPGYDPKTKTYHLFYQLNASRKCTWGDMSWGHVTSKDLINWTRNSNGPVLRADEPYDDKGIFTGCFLPPTEQQDRLTVFYSNISILPIHWSKPYPRGAAGLAAASSTDGGKTWKKEEANPILKEEPKNVSVTGWRDPYVAPWPALDNLRGQESPCLYGAISGGITGEGPTVFMYAIDPQEPLKWDLMGSIIRMPSYYRPSEKWNGSYGINWECTNFMTLRGETSGKEMSFMITSAEGDFMQSDAKEEKCPPGLQPRTARGVIWLSGELTKLDGGEIDYQYRFGGIFDHGMLYAPNSFFDTVNQRQIVYGWLPEEDLPDEYITAKGWNGSLTLPRELFIQEHFGVTGSLQSQIEDLTCFERIKETKSTYTLRTMGIRPISEVDNLRRTTAQHHTYRNITLGGSDPEPAVVAQLSSSTWEATAIISISPDADIVGLTLKNPGGLSSICISFSIKEEILGLYADLSSTDPRSRNPIDKGSHTLLWTRPEGGGPEVLEKLRLRVIWDGDVVEIFANERFALSTTVYMDSDAGRGRTLKAYARGSGQVTVQEINVWDGLDGGKSALLD